MFKLFVLFSILITICSSSSLNFDLFLQPRNFTSVLTSCKTIQKNIIYLTGGCYLLYEDVAKNIEKVKTYVRSQNNLLSVENLLNNGFAGSTTYFQNTYPYFNKEYNDFETRIKTIMNNLKTSTKNVKMEEFLKALTDSKMNIAYENVTALGDRNCGLDSVVCENTRDILSLDETALKPLSVDEFLVQITNNMFKHFEVYYSDKNVYESDQNLVSSFVEELRNSGTATTTIKLLREIFGSKIYEYFHYSYTKSATKPTTKRIRTSKPTTTPKTTGEKVIRTKPPQYVKIDVYLSVPLVILFLGIALSTGIVMFFYKFKPHVGGQKTLTPVQIHQQNTKF